jgi:hypothetical protein
MTVAGVIGSALLVAKKFLAPKAAKPELMSRAEFYVEMLATREAMHASHLAMLDKLEANHRELLGVLERQALRTNALEVGLSRVEERIRKR